MEGKKIWGRKDFFWRWWRYRAEWLGKRGLALGGREEVGSMAALEKLLSHFAWWTCSSDS